MRVVYLLQHKKIPEYTKIGYTDDINQRIKSLSTASPTGIKLLYKRETDYAYQIEQALHKRYSSYNSNLEWFRLSDNQIEEIISWIDDQLDRYEQK